MSFFSTCESRLGIGFSSSTTIKVAAPNPLDCDSTSNTLSPRSPWTMSAWSWDWSWTRLSRSCKDWHHLLEVCAIFGTMLADRDALYDPNDMTDRLVLGLKGDHQRH